MISAVNLSWEWAGEAMPAIMNADRSNRKILIFMICLFEMLK
jgi:hypothetical protein